MQPVSTGVPFSHWLRGVAPHNQTGAHKPGESFTIDTINASSSIKEVATLIEGVTKIGEYKRRHKSFKITSISDIKLLLFRIKQNTTEIKGEAAAYANDVNQLIEQFDALLGSYSYELDPQQIITLTTKLAQNPETHQDTLLRLTTLTIDDKFKETIKNASLNYQKPLDYIVNNHVHNTIKCNHGRNITGKLTSAIEILTNQEKQTHVEATDLVIKLLSGDAQAKHNLPLKISEACAYKVAQRRLTDIKSIIETRDLFIGSNPQIELNENSILEYAKNDDIKINNTIQSINRVRDCITEAKNGSLESWRQRYANQTQKENLLDTKKINKLIEKLAIDRIKELGFASPAIAGADKYSHKVKFKNTDEPIENQAQLLNLAAKAGFETKTSFDSLALIVAQDQVTFYIINQCESKAGEDENKVIIELDKAIGTLRDINSLPEDLSRFITSTITKLCAPATSESILNSVKLELEALVKQLKPNVPRFIPG